MTENAGGNGAGPLQTMDIKRILELLPHRYPFLLVDRVTEVVPGKSIKAYKNVSINEPFFQGHFPGLPVMPGVLILEALAQAGGLMVLSAKPDNFIQNNICLFTGMENVRFRRQVVPGDRLDLTCELIRHKFALWKINTLTHVDGVLATEAVLTAALIPREEVQ